MKSQHTLWGLALVAAFIWTNGAHLAYGQAVEDEPALPPLEEMLAKALKNHPEIDEARAQLLQAQAKLDMVRLEIAHRITEYQKTWRTLELKAKTAEARLQEARAVNARAPGSISPSKMQVFETEVATARAEFSALQSHLPFLLGQTDPETPAPADVDGTRALAEEMLAYAREAYESAAALWEGGKEDQAPVLFWSKRILGAEERLQGMSADSAKRHRQRVQRLLNAVKERFEGGVATRMEYAAAQYYLTEADLLLEQRK
jgi:hypothetical protein